MKLVAKNTTETQKLLVVKQSQDSRDNLCMKLKTRIFRGLGSREISHEKHHWSTEAFSRETVARQSW